MEGTNSWRNHLACCIQEQSSLGHDQLTTKSAAFVCYLSHTVSCRIKKESCVYLVLAIPISSDLVATSAGFFQLLIRTSITHAISSPEGDPIPVYGALLMLFYGPSKRRMPL